MIDVFVGIWEVVELVVEKEVIEDEGLNGVLIFCVVCVGIVGDVVEGFGKVILDVGYFWEVWYVWVGVIVLVGKVWMGLEGNFGIGVGNVVGGRCVGGWGGDSLGFGEYMDGDEVVEYVEGVNDEWCSFLLFYKLW